MSLSPVCVVPSVCVCVSSGPSPHPPPRPLVPYYKKDTIIKLEEEHAKTGLPVGLDVASGEALSPEMAGIWCVRACVRGM